VQAVAPKRRAALNVAYEAHSERFVHGRPSLPLPPSVVTINPIDPGAALQTGADLLAEPAPLPIASWILKRPWFKPVDTFRTHIWHGSSRACSAFRLSPRSDASATAEEIRDPIVALNVGAQVHETHPIQSSCAGDTSKSYVSETCAARPPSGTRLAFTERG